MLVTSKVLTHYFETQYRLVQSLIYTFNRSVASTTIARGLVTSMTTDITLEASFLLWLQSKGFIMFVPHAPPPNPPKY